MSPVETLHVSAEDASSRLDQVLDGHFPEKSRSYFTRLIKSGRILVNGLSVKPGYLLRAGDTIEVRFPEERTDLTAADIPLDIIYEDRDLIVVNKPAGMTVHPGKGSKGDTLVNALLNYTGSLSEWSGSERPGIVHRLDKNTSGLLVVARNDLVHRKLQQQFASKSIRREYRALVWGEPASGEGKVQTQIGRSRRDPTRMTVTSRGRESVTLYRLLQSFRYVSYIALQLETGRTHQIRVHMKYISHPVVGDPEYGGRETQLNRLPVNLKKRGIRLLELLPYQFLHAAKLDFIHPLSEKPMRFEVPLPGILQSTLEKIPHLFLLTDHSSDTQSVSKK